MSAPGRPKRELLPLGGHEGRRGAPGRPAIARAAAALACAVAAFASPPALGASCEWAVRFTNDIVDYGDRAMKSEDYIIARRTASDARSIAVDAAREAKNCGCTAAIPSYETVAQQGRYAGNAANLTAAQQYGQKIKQAGEAALEALRHCPGN